MTIRRWKRGSVVALAALMLAIHLPMQVGQAEASGRRSSVVQCVRSCNAVNRECKATCRDDCNALFPRGRERWACKFSCNNECRSKARECRRECRAGKPPATEQEP